ncbi:MAG: AAA family ATPase [Bacteroidota bacterium]
MPRAQASPRTAYHSREILGHIHAYLAARGFFYTKQTLANFFLCLKSKPMLMLAGASGTGKTQLVRQFAAAIGAKDRCFQIPVRPNWTEPADLIGYPTLDGQFRRGPFLEALWQAHQAPHLPHLVLLDEMNLARVEHYFSDVLSIWETREKQGRRITTDPLITKQVLGTAIEQVPELLNLDLPDNLYLIGTVNIDEATVGFSKKVLDRMSVLEMQDIQLDWPMESEKIEPLTGVFNDFLKSPYVHLQEIPESQRPKLRELMLLLMEINGILHQAELQVGYRVRDEMAFYVLNRYEIREAISENEALDYLILQKILPRIQGGSPRIRAVLLELIQLCGPEEITLGEAPNYRDLRQRVGKIRPTYVRFPRSLEKLFLMYRRWEEDGFASFWL